MTANTENDRSKHEDDVVEPGVDEQNSASQDPADALEQEAAELRAKWLRAQADYKNLKRRAASELEGGIRRRLQPLLDELLLVMDYLDMALAAPVESAEARNLSLGVEMTRTKLMQALEQVEVHVIETDGDFDPEQHEAAETRPADGVSPGTILAVVRKGYAWREVVLRHAQVVVAEGAEGPTQADEPERSMTDEPRTEEPDPATED